MMVGFDSVLKDGTSKAKATEEGDEGGRRRSTISKSVLLVEDLTSYNGSDNLLILVV